MSQRQNIKRKLEVKLTGKETYVGEGVKVKIESAASINKQTKLLQDKNDLEQQVPDDYQAVFKMKKNPKSFFSFSKSRQAVQISFH